MTTSPWRSNASAATTFSASLSMTSWPLRSSLGLDGGTHGDAQLAAAGKDIDGAVVVASQEHAVARRRLRQPVDFFAQRDDLLAGFLQR